MTKLRSVILILAALTMSAALSACAWAEDLVISNLTELLDFRKAVNDEGNSFAGETVVLSGDITLSGEWTPIGTDEHPFSGKFNGGNHKIENMTITTDEMQPLTVAGVKGAGGGLFLNVSGEGAQIANLTVTGTINAEPDKADGAALVAGGIAARLGPGAVIYRCLSEVSITLGGSTSSTRDSFAYAGGVAGYSEGHVIYCVNEGGVTVEADTNNIIAGGIAGAQHGGSILFSDNDGEVTADDSGSYRRTYAGGIAGSVESASVSCVRNQKAVSSDTLAGGITAFAMDAVLRDAVNISEVTCYGQKDGDATAGGIVAQLYNGSAAVNCYNTGGVTIEGSPAYSYAGGIAGWSSAGRYASNKIYNCTNEGRVKASASVFARTGGLVGELNKTELYASVNTGGVSAVPSSALGGVAGYKYPTSDIHDVAYSGDVPPVGVGDRNASDAQALTKTEVESFIVTAFPSLDPVIVCVAKNSPKEVNVSLHSHPGEVGESKANYYTISSVYVEPQGHATATTNGSAISVTGTAPGVSLLAAYVDTYRSGANGTVDKSSPSRSLVSALVWVTDEEITDTSEPDEPSGGDINIPAGPIEIPGSGGSGTTTPPLWPDGATVPSVPGEPDTDKSWDERYPRHSCGGGCNSGWGALALLAFAPLMLRKKK